MGGEINDLKTPAPSRYLDNGLQWFGWTCLDTPCWIHAQRDQEIPPPLYADRDVIGFVRGMQSPSGPDDLQRGHLSGWLDGVDLGWTIASTFAGVA